MDQYSALIALMPQIEDLLKEKGETVPRPDYASSGAAHARDEGGHSEDEDEDEKPKKTNFEATSDEDED